MIKVRGCRYSPSPQPSPATNHGRGKSSLRRLEADLGVGAVAVRLVGRAAAATEIALHCAVHRMAGARDDLMGALGLQRAIGKRQNLERPVAPGKRGRFLHLRLTRCLETRARMTAIAIGLLL